MFYASLLLSNKRVDRVRLLVGVQHTAMRGNEHKLQEVKF